MKELKVTLSRADIDQLIMLLKENSIESIAEVRVRLEYYLENANKSSEEDDKKWIIKIVLQFFKSINLPEGMPSEVRDEFLTWLKVLLDT